MTPLASLSDLSDLTGRTAVVTGGARGMGAAHAEALAARGARVLIADLDAEVHDTAADLTARGGDVAGVVLDVTAPDAADTLRAALASFAGGSAALDILVHNAGIMHDWRELDVTEPDELDRYFRVNVKAPYAITRGLVDLLRASEHARVIIISSTWGQVPDGHSFGYMISKSAQLGLMKSLAAALLPDGILVNAVAPGSIHTRMIPDEYYDVEVASVPLGRLGKPEEIAETVAFLASDSAGFLTGQTLSVNGGALRVGI
ncbi:SDR family oxidoreductase [Leucobacter sp. cx-42]|uniref:SDR family NAD(P)-dependent oxidoreductase n=1 Tax=unclassified Leucobacter TaxID=2621730 RepID=UPI00165DFC01|nr:MULTISPECIES: SDR family NAD(P)-dependent oxidoreductase [unclassified Leucobacter]MBC9953199.1 SDR family oxidoreductase [Leucobacter sp. cx-42]